MSQLLETGELQEQLFAPAIDKLDGSLGVLALTFQPLHLLFHVYRLADEDEWAALEAASSYMEMHDIDPSPAMELARRYDRALGYDHDVIERLEGILERIGKA